MLYRVVLNNTWKQNIYDCGLQILHNLEDGEIIKIKYIASCTYVIVESININAGKILKQLCRAGMFSKVELEKGKYGIKIKLSYENPLCTYNYTHYAAIETTNISMEESEKIVRDLIEDIHFPKYCASKIEYYDINNYEKFLDDKQRYEEEIEGIAFPWH